MDRNTLSILLVFKTMQSDALTQGYRNTVQYPMGIYKFSVSKIQIFLEILFEYQNFREFLSTSVVSLLLQKLILNRAEIHC